MRNAVNQSDAPTDVRMFNDLEHFIAWRLCSDTREAIQFLSDQSGFRTLLTETAPESGLLRMDFRDLASLAEALDRSISQSVLFGQPPDGFDITRATKENGSTSMKRTDYNRALWLAITDPDFREGCFGNVKATLDRYDLSLSEDELGKFCWFDAEKLAGFLQTLDGHLVDAVSAVASKKLATAPSSTEGKPGERDDYRKAYMLYVNQVDRIRSMGAQLAKSESWLDQNEFDPGPPAHDFVSFMRVLNCRRLYGYDLDRICVESGLLVGRITMILKIASELDLDMPEHPGCGPIPASHSRAFSEAVFRHRPPLNERHHQSPCSPAAVLERVREISTSEWLYGKNIVVLGDDDGISVALAAFTDAAAVTVIDIDPDVITFLENLADDMGVSIETRLQDLREPLPKNLAGRFWLVNADPPQNPEGERFFLEKAFELLGPEVGHRVYCSITPFWMGFDRFHAVMSFLLRHGFVSADIHKCMMAFPVSVPSDIVSQEDESSEQFVESALASLTNMACDIHVLQRATYV